MADVVDPGVVGAVQGGFVSEGWHYVGESGEPAFQNSWANVSGSVKMAFRIRESGVVDIQGTVAPGSSAGVFILPDGYRPSVAVSIPVAYESSGLLVGLMNIGTNGTVQMPGASGTYYFVNDQFFLDPPALAP